MTGLLRVGVIGVNAERGWARESHIPAIKAVDGLQLVAVATRDQRSAAAAGAAFGVDRAYADAADLIADPDVDIVAVTSPAPAHRDLIVAAVRAGKHVITEWPVGTGTSQTEEIARVSAGSRVRTAVGLQAAANPAALRAAELVRSGAVGRVLTATVHSTTAGFGPRVPDNALALEDPATGMNLTTIQLAHTLDFAIRLAGPITSVAALLTVQYPDLEVGDPPRPHRRTVADHVLLHARLAGGGALAVQVAGGRPPDDTPFRLDVVGDRGGLTVEGGAPRGFQAGSLRLRLNGDPVEVDDRATAGLSASAVNVAGVYTALRDDIRHGTSTAPGFGDAVRLSHLIDAVAAAGSDGRARTLDH